MVKGIEKEKKKIDGERGREKRQNEMESNRRRRFKRLLHSF